MFLSSLKRPTLLCAVASTLIAGKFTHPHGWAGAAATHPPHPPQIWDSAPPTKNPTEHPPSESFHPALRPALRPHGSSCGTCYNLFPRTGAALRPGTLVRRKEEEGKHVARGGGEQGERPSARAVLNHTAVQRAIPLIALTAPPQQDSPVLLLNARVPSRPQRRSLLALHRTRTKAHRPSFHPGHNQPTKAPNQSSATKPC